MNQLPNHRINESIGRCAKWLLILGIIGFAILMFRQVLAPDCCLFSTDDNIGIVSGVKSVLPHAFLGSWGSMPYIGNPGLFYPNTLNSLLIWLLPPKFYINWIHAINLSMASIFFAMFMRGRRVGWAGIALGLLTAYWLGSNLTLTYAGHIVKYGVLMLSSAALFCISRVFDRHTSLLWSVVAGGAVGLMFLEQLDVALFFGFVLGAYALFLAARQWRLQQTWMKSAGVLVLMGSVAFFIAADTMFSGYRTNVAGAANMQTESPQEKWAFVTQWSWPPDECIDFIAPGYMGWRSGEPEGPYWGRMGQSAGWEQTRQGFMNFKLENTYIGIIPILLALFAILSGMMGGRSNGVWECGSKGVDGEIISYADTSTRPYSITSTRAEIMFWACVALVTLLLSFGKFFPLYALFYKLPVVSSIRNPNKFLQVFQLALGILSAYGLDGLIKKVCNK